ncbi:CAP domain-containing protein [Chitinophaga sp. NPDC101104]|uniref:CAP domain-containing protein n=1 Tax=Chitinophaga sp. NPDC101104 TaxID=3390561 RepID=UPI003CFD1953
MKNSILACAAGLLLLCACTKEPLEEWILPENGKASLPFEYKDTSFVMTQRVDSANMLRLVNAFRAKGCNCGEVYMPPAPPLTWNIRLEKASWLHSKEMKDSVYMSHTGRNGSTGGDRIRKMGFNWHRYAENIALGILTEKTVVEGWMGSKTHCMAMMDPMLKETGIARSGNYWTQELALSY